jgi:glycerol kinase
MKYILALDQGTTSSRAIVFDHAGAIKSVAQKEFKQYFPQPGWVEHDAGEIWATQAGVATEALTKAGLSHKDIAGIGITNQRETTVVWNRETSQPVGHAIVWQDRRTAGFCDQLRRDGLEGTIQKKTGLVILLFRQQARLDPRKRARGEEARRGRQARFRHGRFLAGLEIDRRQGASHRRDQRQPHHALQHPHRRLG